MRVLPILMSLLLAACTAPSTQRGPGAQHIDVAQQQAAAAAKPQSGRSVKMPPLGGPLPPERVQGYCEADADCSMRADRKGCATCTSRNDIASSDESAAGKACGPQQTECRCVDQRCQAKPLLIDSPVEQAAPEDHTP
jgi:hypothetical protein